MSQYPPIAATTRRGFMAMAAAAGAAPGRALAASPIRAVAFDAFPILDPRAVFALARQLAPKRGEALRELWFQKLFAYTWLHTTAGRYVGFAEVIAESLDYAAAATGVALTRAQRDQLIGAFWSLPVWPDVKEELAGLRAAGLRLAFLSNMSEPMLRANLRHNGIEPLFEAVLSTDRVRAFKPASAAYALGPQALSLRKPEIAFAAFAAWDAAGASWFGYPTAWVNRLGQPPETVGAPPAVAAGRDLGVVADLVRRAA